VVLRDISFCVSRGQMMVVLGAGGSGKSVLLKLILGLLEPDAGRIRTCAASSPENPHRPGKTRSDPASIRRVSAHSAAIAAVTSGTSVAPLFTIAPFFTVESSEVVAMVLHRALRLLPAALLLAAVAMSVGLSAQSAPLAMDTARVTIAGTSNIHNYTAWTDTVRLTRVKLAAPLAQATFWDDIVRPGALEAFEVLIPAATLTGRDAGLNRNMYRALKVDANRDVTFRLTRFERDASGALVAVGVLRIAAVERDVIFGVTTEARDGALVVKGALALLMTDYGIKPPTAMLGMLKTDPQVTVTFEVVLSVPRT
jgi:energy-coupling factor transporter ATP-binding protein EcfA2